MICYEELLIKDWNRSGVFMRIISKQWNYVLLNYLFMLILKLKPSMKNWCYNGIGKRIWESEDIIAACTCPAGSGIKCFGKCNHVGTILFVLEDFNRKKLKTFAEPLTCTSQLLKQNVPHDSSTNPSPIDKTIVKKINLETIRTQKLNQKIIVMTHAHQYLGNDLQNCLLSSGLFLS